MSAPDPWPSAGQQRLLEDFAAAVAGLRCDPEALGQQTRLVEAVTLWTAGWPAAAEAMQARLRATADRILAGG